MSRLWRELFSSIGDIFTDTNMATTVKICIILLNYIRSMVSLGSLVNFAVKTALIITLALTAAVPVIFLGSHECLHNQEWSDGLAFHAPRASQIDAILEVPLANIYLRKGSTKLTWSDVEYTTSLADYVNY